MNAHSPMSTLRELIYVITGGPKHVKIGVSVDVKKRLIGIQTGCPHRVVLKRSWASPDARLIERLAHRKLAKYRIRGEWFDVPVSVAVLTVNALVAANYRLTPRRNTRRDLNKSVVFCRACEHSVLLPYIPKIQATFHCTKCAAKDQAHCVEL